MDVATGSACRRTIDRICGFAWEELSRGELMAAGWAYHHFSIQFRENLKIARRLHPQDGKLAQLEAEECDTDNLSPWPGVAAPGARLDHDEFLRRALLLSPFDDGERARLEAAGQRYLERIRAMDPAPRASSIASYEDGGLDKVFHAFLHAPDWGGPALPAFRHFLVSHIRFDSDPQHGHGALSRHLRADDRVLPLWTAFADLLVESVPQLAGTR